MVVNGSAYAADGPADGTNILTMSDTASSRTEYSRKAIHTDPTIFRLFNIHSGVTLFLSPIEMKRERADTQITMETTTFNHRGTVESI